MFDSEPPYEPYDVDGMDYDEEPRRPSRLRSCLFVGITLAVVFSLIGSSLFAFFLVTRRAAQQAEQNAQLEELRRVIVGVDQPPTAAPSTLVAAVPTPAATATPAPPQLAVNRIAFINADGHVETVSPTGDDRRVLTTGSGVRYQFPAWSPESDRVAVIGNRMTGAGIYVLDDAETSAANAGRIYYSSSTTPFYLYWSPDSENLAFLASGQRGDMALNVVPSDGARESRRLATGNPFYWDWTADGSRLLVHAGQSGREDTLALIDLAGEDQAGSLAEPGQFQAPGISASGRYWAFAEAARGGLSSLVVVDTETGERERHDEAGSLVLSWSPTGDRLAFTSGHAEGHPYWGPLRMLDMATGETRILSTETVIAFFWSPDGRSIAFITLNRIDDDGGVNAQAPDKIRRVSRAASVPAQQRQGSLTLSVISVETGEGLRLLSFEPTTLFLAQYLPFFDQYALSHRVWSPDSQSLVLAVRQEFSSVVMVVPADGGRAYPIAEGDAASWSHR